jgi:Holliday junction DNA helicase RuvA
MIAHIEGKVLYASDKYAIVSTSGVGYKLFLSIDNLSKCKPGEDIVFFVYTAVRENAIDLYGFADIAEMNFFELLLTISGIGPKSAMSVMNVTSVETLSEAIATGDTAYLTKVSGIGKKTAERIVIELKDKVVRKESYNAGALRNESDALEVLKSLGYREAESRDVLRTIDSSLSTSQRVKEALKLLGK